MLKRIIFVSFFVLLTVRAWADYDFDHSRYSQLLSDVVVDGLVDYKVLLNRRSILDQYLKEIAQLSANDFRSMNREEQMALYINAYNAYTLKAIIDKYPVKSIRWIPFVWDKKTAIVAGTKMSLNNIEHDTLRPKYQDPRVHFALNCASGGCPELRAEAYISDELENQLEDATYRFMNDRVRNPYDKEKNIYDASSIFKWFKEDFGDVRAFISKYLRDDKVSFDQNKPKLKYQYDWSLNDVNS